jgi:hypothetical protein
MKKIDIMLEKWIHCSIIRDQLRKLIVKEIDKEVTKERIKILTWDSQIKNKR